MYQKAIDEPFKAGVLQVYGHGSNAGFYGTSSIVSIQEQFLNDSVMWREYTKNRFKGLVLELKVCGAGSQNINGSWWKESLHNYSVAQELSRNNLNLTVWGAASGWLAVGPPKLGFNAYFDGKWILSAFNR